MADKLPIVDDKPWYHEGLKFSCTECGKCCTGSPGYVWLTDDDITRISEYLKITESLFKRRYTRFTQGKYSLIDLPKQNYDCVFLEGKKCQIYPVRPKQCGTYPFWPHVLSSKKSWDNEAAHCEGIQQDGELISLKTIQEKLK